MRARVVASIGWIVSVVVTALPACVRPRPQPAPPVSAPPAPTAPAPAVVDRCAFGGDVARKYRWATKRRDPSPTAATPVTPSEMIAWPDPRGVEDLAVRRRDDPAAPLDPREREPRVLEGDVWVAKIEANDCDWHLELSEPGGGEAAPRVIVEVPQGDRFAPARATIASMLGLAAITEPCFRLVTPARVRVTGLPFYDGKHWSPSHPRVGWRHGSAAVATLWELHPVWRVEVLARGEARRCAAHERERERDQDE